ncbi:hypothetical protein [Hyalangium versicolor]|uniref:hypothetical protein n=1 Tax=Hyalangium versicolor TaxID=2861190 RepID=UPI001CCE3E8B|nr:hypothetical protein [Hyalangium versicolor]
MTTSSTQAPQSHSRTEGAPAPSDPFPTRPILLLGGLLVLLLIALITWGLISERRAVEQMNPQTRAAVFQETWKSFQLLCREGVDSALTSRCRDQARFLSDFPECQADCRQQLDGFYRPSR